jgi:hypothetical protein
MKFWARAIVVCFGAAACGLEVTSDFPPTAVPFATPQLFRAWWHLVEECSGKSRPVDAVRWYRVQPGELTIRGESAAGAWFVSGNRIVLNSWALREGGLVRHEMLHAILETGSHPAEYFEGKCGAEVACGFDCTEQHALPNAHQAALEQLEGSVALYPQVPSIGALDGRVTVVVKVRNPANGNVFVSNEQFGSPQCVIGVMVESIDDPRWTKWVCGWLAPANDGKIYFRPGETRRLVLDFDMRLRTSIGSFRTGRITVSSIIADNVRKSLVTTVLP